jgi:hypothetical protein
MTPSTRTSASTIFQAPVAARADTAFSDAPLAALAAADAPLRRALARIAGHLVGRRGWESLGYVRIGDYARERLGMAPRKARTLLCVERACQASVALRKAWRAGTLSLAQAQTLASLFALDHSQPWQAMWIVRAGEVTLRRLCDDVDAAIASGILDPAALPAVPAGLQSGAPHRDSEDTPHRPGLHLVPKPPRPPRRVPLSRRRRRRGEPHHPVRRPPPARRPRRRSPPHLGRCAPAYFGAPGSSLPRLTRSSTAYPMRR